MSRIDDALEIARLAALDPIEYERQRAAAAERLGITRLSVLDELVRAARGAPPKDDKPGRALSFAEIDACGAPVDGAELLDDMTGLLGRFVMMPEASRTAVALWCIHTFLFERLAVTPRLVIKSVQKRSGKTTLLRLVAALVPRPLHTASLSPAALYRSIELARPTLLIDEADHFARDGHENLRALLNDGFQRDGQAVRTVGDDHEPRQFSCWAPVALALIGKLSDTLEDRSIRIVLQRRRRDETIERLRLDRLPEIEPLRQRIRRWTDDYAERVAAADPELPDDLDDRAADCWRGLVAIADRAAGAWPARARGAACTLSFDADDTETTATRLLRAIKELFDERAEDELFSAEIVAHLFADEAGGWSEMGRGGKPLTVVRLARLLARFRIHPGTVRRGAQTQKGYAQSAFRDAWERYL